MKIAVVVAGHYRSFDQCLLHILKELEGIDVDWYLATWDNINAARNAGANSQTIEANPLSDDNISTLKSLDPDVVIAHQEFTPDELQNTMHGKPYRATSYYNESILSCLQRIKDPEQYTYIFMVRYDISVRGLNLANLRVPPQTILIGANSNKEHPYYMFATDIISAFNPADLENLMSAMKKSLSITSGFRICEDITTKFLGDVFKKVRHHWVFGTHFLINRGSPFDLMDDKVVNESLWMAPPINMTPNALKRLSSRFLELNMPEQTIRIVSKALANGGISSSDREECDKIISKAWSIIPRIPTQYVNLYRTRAVVINQSQNSSQHIRHLTEGFSDVTIIDVKRDTLATPLHPPWILSYDSTYISAHIQALENTIVKDGNPVIIFDGGAERSSNFKPFFSVPHGSDAFFLGVSVCFPPVSGKMVGENMIRMDKFYGLHAKMYFSAEYAKDFIRMVVEEGKGAISTSSSLCGKWNVYGCYYPMYEQVMPYCDDLTMEFASKVLPLLV